MGRVQGAAKKAGVESWFPHQLRHLAATKVRRDYDVEAAQMFLGHKDLKVTQVYAERNLRRAREVALAMG